MLIRMRKSMTNQKGFTLIELMVVIAIIGILAAIAIPKFTAANDSARGAKMAADLRTIDSAIAIAIAQGTATPAVADVTALLAAYPVPPATTSKFTGPVHTTATLVPAATYTISASLRAVCGALKAEDI